MRAEFTQYSVPGWGVGEVWTGDRLLLAHELRFGPVSDDGVERASGFSRDLVERFRTHLAGGDVSFEDVELDLGQATPFQLAVVEALRRIPCGEVASYGEAAALAGYPGAARGVGNVCAHNRFMLVVPCHRVVGASGIGGYGSAGVDVKRRLLALEGVVV